MRSKPHEAVRSRKLGSENAIVVPLPPDRFLDMVKPHHRPPIDQEGRYTVMLLAQHCARCSFEDAEAGPSQELHLWLQLGATTEDPPIENVDIMLRSMHWLALIAATNNRVVEARLRSFGFDPRRCAGMDLQPGGGFLELQDGARLDWSIAGPGRGPATVGVRHGMFMPAGEPCAAGHRVAARISGAVMAQPGELRVAGSSLEPFLLAGERLPVLVHRMPKLEADVVWRRRSETS